MILDVTVAKYASFWGGGDLRSKVARSEVEKKRGEKMEGKNTEFGRFKNDNTIVTIVTIQNEMVNIFLRSFGILEGFIFSLQGFSDAFLRI